MLAIPVFMPMAAAIIVFAVGKLNKGLRDILAGLFTIIEVLMLVYFGYISLMSGDIVSTIPGICQMGMSFKLDGFRLLYGMIAAFMWMMTTLFSPEYFAHHHNRSRYYFFVLMTLGATVGVFLSADLFTTFICFEIMSFTSYAWVAQEETKEALRASETYLAVAVIGGMVMLMGLFLLYFNVHTLEIDKLYEACRDFENKGVIYAAASCMLVGFGAKAGMFPLHIWLPKAHPVAPAPASALLSGILTKSGIYGVLVISTQILRHDEMWGYVILSLGVITMFLGAFIALFSINLKRTLACSSMSQIGFILVGVGMQCLLGEENALAVRGTVLHMVNHSMIKLILFMAAGVIYFNMHKLTLNEIRGFGRKKPILTGCFAVGALSISGFPLFSGYVSKTLLHESIVEYSEIIEHTSAYGIIHAIEWIFLLTGGMTFAYMLKLFICIFVEHNTDEAIQEKMDAKNGHYMNVVSTFALTLPSVILFVMGVAPYNVMNKMAHIALPFMAGEEPEEMVMYFSLGNLKGGCISLSIGLIVYLLFIRNCLMKKQNDKKVYVNIWPEWLDLENMIYRPLVLGIIPFIMAFVLRCFDKLMDFVIFLNMKFVLNSMDDPRNIPYKDNIIAYKNKMVDAADSVKDTSRLAAKSVSYGLLTFSIGFLVTLIYLIYKMKTFGM